MLPPLPLPAALRPAQDHYNKYKLSGMAADAFPDPTQAHQHQRRDISTLMPIHGGGAGGERGSRITRTAGTRRV